MGKFKFTKTPIAGLVIIEPTVYSDERGFFMETYSYRDFKRGGIDINFVQDNHSHSKKWVLRGLHFQKKHLQGKLVRVVNGKVFDVAVDLRKGSKTFGKWFSIELSGENKRQFYIPPGFAHGFLSLEDDTDFLYKCTDYYYPGDEGGIVWNDSAINIRWPIGKVEDLIISDKDKALPTFKDAIKELW
jgi:dTDP-4-dehydrorhamnose 3,5-epimerase